MIGNEHYQGNIKGVPYAANDAEIFAKYCRRTLGLPANNVLLLTDATLEQMASAIEEIKNKSLARPGETRIIFYYSGHGKPDDNDKQAYMVPVDASPYSNRTHYSLSELYKELGNSNAQLVTIFLDACFSGATRTDDMLVAARAMRQSPLQDTPAGNVVVFSAASDTETAHPIAGAPAAYCEKTPKPRKVRGEAVYYLDEGDNVAHARSMALQIPTVGKSTTR